jgi:hypothetical protein
LASAPAIKRRGILSLPELELLRSAFVVVLDGRLGEVRRLLREELRAEEPSRPNFDAA